VSANTLAAPSPQATFAASTRTMRAPRSPTVGALLALRRDRAAQVGIGLCVLLVGAALFAPLVAPYDPIVLHIQDRLQNPSSTYLLGTDELGRDVLSRLIYGAQTSLAVGAIALAIAATTGTLLGLLGGLVVVEQIFAWPGVGWLMIQSITHRDYDVVQGAVLLVAIGFLAINLAVDVVYAYLDPRIRYA